MKEEERREEEERRQGQVEESDEAEGAVGELEVSR